MMLLAIELLREKGKETLAFRIDNKATIHAPSAFVSKPGHHLMDKFHDDLCVPLHKHDKRKLTIRWTPGHQGILVYDVVWSVAFSGGSIA
jgi:hypothetical protein